MTATQAFRMISAIFGVISVYYNKRNDHAADAALFLAYAMLVAAVAIIWRSYGN